VVCLVQGAGLGWSAKSISKRKKKAGYDGKVVGLLNGTTERKRASSEYPAKNKKAIYRVREFFKKQKGNFIGRKLLWATDYEL